MSESFKQAFYLGSRPASQVSMGQNMSRKCPGLFRLQPFLYHPPCITYLPALSRLLQGSMWDDGPGCPFLAMWKSPVIGILYIYIDLQSYGVFGRTLESISPPRAFRQEASWTGTGSKAPAWPRPLSSRSLRSSCRWRSTWRWDPTRGCSPYLGRMKD